MANQGRPDERRRASGRTQARTGGRASQKTASEPGKTTSAARGAAGTAAPARAPARAPGRAAARGRAAAPGKAAAGPGKAGAGPGGHALTVTIPLDRAIDVATFPVTAASRVLSAKGGLPVYLGLGVLAVADVIDLPLAAATGVGYAVLRRWGPLRPRRPASGEKAGQQTARGEQQ
jgi:hypothetical protein